MSTSVVAKQFVSTCSLRNKALQTCMKYGRHAFSFHFTNLAKTVPFKGKYDVCMFFFCYFCFSGSSENFLVHFYHGAHTCATGRLQSALVKKKRNRQQHLNLHASNFLFSGKKSILFAVKFWTMQ